MAFAVVAMICAAAACKNNQAPAEEAAVETEAVEACEGCDSCGACAGCDSTKCEGCDSTAVVAE